MKRFFFNEDGTIKLINMLVLLGTIFLLAIVVVYVKFFYVEEDAILVEKPNKENATSSVNMCNGCDFNFKSESISFNTYNDYLITDYFDYSKVALNNIKFLVDDKSLLDIEARGNKIYLVTKNKVGKTKISATYDKIKRDVWVDIQADSIRSVDFHNHPYYIYNAKENQLEIVTDPVGIDLSDLVISIDNPNICEYRDGMLVGLMEGSTKINLQYKEFVATQDLYVFNNLIHIEGLNKDGNEESVYKIDLDEFKDNQYEIIVTIDDDLIKEYSMSDLVITHEDENIDLVVTYNGKKEMDNNSYKYLITKTEGMGSSLIKFSLGNTVRFLEIGE